MKKLQCIILALSLVFLFGCTNKNENNAAENRSTTSGTTDFSSEEQVIENIVVLPSEKDITNTYNIDLPSWDKGGIFIEEMLSDKYYCLIYSLESGSDTMDNRNALMSRDLKNEISLDYGNVPKSVDVSSASYTVLKNRYLYEFDCYESQSDDNENYNVNLIRIDGETEKVEQLYVTISTELSTVSNAEAYNIIPLHRNNRVAAKTDNNFFILISSQNLITPYSCFA